MKVTTESTPDHQVVVTVEVDEDQLQHALVRAAQHISRIRPLPGFRPGKAPYNLIERAVGKDTLLEEATEELSKSLYGDVLKDNKIEPADQGHLEVVQKEPPIFKYTIPKRPEVKVGDYQSIHLNPAEVQVSDEEVNQVLERYRMSQATMVPVTRAIQNGDAVTLDVKGGVPEHTPVDEKNVRVVIGDAKQPGLPFEDQLIGLTEGESKQIAYSYPEDYADEAFRGKTAEYTVTINDIKETQMPALSDDFAQAVSQFKTLEQFKGNIREILRRQKQVEEESRFADQVVDALVDKSEILFPPVMLERETDSDLERLKQDEKKLGLTWEKYLELSGKTLEQMRGEIRPRAEKELKRALVLNELVETEKPEVTPQEVNADIDRRVQQAERAGGNPHVARRSYTTRDARQNIEFNLRLNKTISKLIATAKGEPVSGKILTPGMLSDRETSPIPSGLITDPSKVREEDWPKGLERKA
jgi:trigger factor